MPQLLRLRRDRIGFIFQFFNLLPMLTARENIVLPLSITEEPDPEWVEELIARSDSAIDERTGRRRCPADSNTSRSPARSSASRP